MPLTTSDPGLASSRATRLGRMRKLAFALSLFIATLGSARACGPVLVSGFDDVMRQADNTGLLRAARRLLSPDVGYAGMPELYHLLVCPDDEPPLYVVSAITSALQTRARSFLARAGFPASKLHFRSWLLQWSPERFKWARIEALLSRHAGRRFVFVLDNSPTSVRLGRRLLRAHAPRVASIYLRETVRRELPRGLTPFHTAFDIAAREFELGRLTAGDVARVTEAVLAASDPEHVIPSYSHCPTALPSCARGDAEVLRQCERVRARISAICRARQRPAGER